MQTLDQPGATPHGWSVDIVESGRSVPRSSKPPIVPPPRPRPPQTFLQQKQRIMGILAVAALALGAKSLLSVRSSHGSPMGESVRTPDSIATLMQTLEPYVPSLHRNPEKDRYRIALHLQPLSESAKSRIIPIARGVQAREFAWTRILGSDGQHVWCNVQGLVGVNIATGELVRADDLRKANPGYNEDWNDPRRLSCSDQLRASTADRSIVLAVDPNTLRVSRTAAPKPSGYLPFDPKPEHFLAFAVRPTSNQWLSLLSPAQATGSFRPGSRLSLTDHAESVREPRHLQTPLTPPPTRGSGCLHPSTAAAAPTDPQTPRSAKAPADGTPSRPDPVAGSDANPAARQSDRSHR